MIEQNKIKMYQAWYKPIHAEFFDVWSNLSLRALRKTYESFNEVYLFKKYQPLIKEPEFLEIGCATGELYRYMKAYFPRMEYYGFDISEPAIFRAKEKYRNGNFFICNEDLSNIHNHCKSPAVLFARDVVLHQPEPFDFLTKLISIPNEAIILRVRTRDQGKSILDPKISCQWHHQEWVPYMILNIDEVINTIKKSVAFSSLHILKNYQQLGGWNSRFLPKDCYYPETGTAETAIFIKLTSEKVSNPIIEIESRLDSKSNLTVFERCVGFLNRRFKAMLRRKIHDVDK